MRITVSGHAGDDAKHDVVEEWIANYEQDGASLPPATAGSDVSGKFVVRVGKDLHTGVEVRSGKPDKASVIARCQSKMIVVSVSVMHYI